LTGFDTEKQVSSINNFENWQDFGG